MEIVVNAMSTAVLIVIEIILFFILMRRVLPLLLRVKCTLKGSKSRGLQRYIYPEGRGVAYEPRPSMRKYMDRYILFTNEGYKYLKCRLCGAIDRLEYTVVMFDAKNKVIDVIDVAESKPFRSETSSVMLHHNTAYADVIITSVNGEKITNKSVLCYKVWDIAIYTLAVALLCFGQLSFIYGMINLYLGWFGLAEYLLRLNVVDFIIPSLIIGVIMGAFAYLNGHAKGVRGSVSL